jgi:hypothetical protein
MVSKCANPACSVSFRYLHTGKLFRFDARYTAESAASARVARNTAELFWLCGDCAKKLVVVWDPDEGARTVARDHNALLRAS